MCTGNLLQRATAAAEQARALGERTHGGSQGFPWGRGELISTDDHPIVEYLLMLRAKVEAFGYRNLPQPGVVY